MRAKVAGLAWLLIGCTAEERGATPVDPGEAIAIPAVVGAHSDVPADRQAVLAELAPVPGGAVVIVYDIEGPAGIAGSLEVLVAQGGYRRDNWRVSLPLPEGAQEIRGSRLRTPELVWRGDGDDVGQTHAAPLGAIAAGIAELGAEQRAAVFDELRAWRSELTRAREENPGTRERIADIECTRVRAGAGEVCTWEELGLPLRYDGAAFRVTARHIERGARLGPHAFEIPAGAVATGSDDEAAPRLAAIVAGDRGEILRLLQPELELMPELGPAR
jgi:hypothetical protein